MSDKTDVGTRNQYWICNLWLQQPLQRHHQGFTPLLTRVGYLDQSMSFGIMCRCPNKYQWQASQCKGKLIGMLKWSLAKRDNYTSALNTSKAKPLKQLITACCTSNPRLSKALMVESKRPGRRVQNMWMLTALPSLTLTSTYKTRNTKITLKQLCN